MSQTLHPHRDLIAHRDANASGAWGATVRLAALVSILAALAAVVLTSLVEMSTTAVVLPTILVGFIASWVRSARQHT